MTRSALYIPAANPRAMEKARSSDPKAVALALEGLSYDGATLGGLHRATMRAADHQLQQQAVVSIFDRVGSEGVRHDVEGSGYGFRSVRLLKAETIAQPARCEMVRPR